jgi:hypothetical protein
MNAIMRRCSRCKQTSPLSSFYKRKTYDCLAHVYQRYCKRCLLEYQRDYLEQKYARADAYREAKKRQIMHGSS